VILLIGEDGKSLGNMSFERAKEIALECNKNLILVNKGKNIYKIGDAGKLKYEKKRREKKLKAQQKANKIKEIQVRPNIDNNDLKIKVNRIREFLNQGLKTKLVMRFKRQQMVYSDVGMLKIKSIVDDLIKDGIATISHQPKLNGNNISVLLMPVK